jgi:hypothetical protein
MEKFIKNVEDKNATCKIKIDGLMKKPPANINKLK